MKYLWKLSTLSVAMLLLIMLAAVVTNAQMSKVKTVFVVMMENHNRVGNDAGASFNDPDIDHNPLAPYINGTLKKIAAQPLQYYNPPGNHPSQPNYLWLEAGTNFGQLGDTQPGQVPGIKPDSQHLVRLLQNAGISWKAYAEPDYGSPVFAVCPLDFSYLDVNHLAPVYFNDVNDGLNPNSPECLAHVVPYYQLATDLADHTTVRYNLVIPNLCHQGHEGVSPCDPSEPGSNTLRADQWLKKNLPVILESDAYKEGGALFVIWDEAEDTDQYSDGPIFVFLLSPLAKGGGKRAYTNKIHYDHSSTLKTIEEIFKVTPLLGAAADPKTKDLSDLFKSDGARK
jgi:phosphatidylinositol-3-phosphatase